MDIANNYFIQLGALGIIILGLMYFSKYLFTYVMKQMQDQIAENKKLETEFRDFLLKNSAEHLIIIQRNTEAYERLIDVFDKIADKL